MQRHDEAAAALEEVRRIVLATSGADSHPMRDLEVEPEALRSATVTPPVARP